MIKSSTMKIEKAQAAAKLLFLLYKFKIISEKRYRKLVNYLTVKSLAYQMKEDTSGKFNKEE